jgi:hypothetical protein
MLIVMGCDTVDMVDDGMLGTGMGSAGVVGTGMGSAGMAGTGWHLVSCGRGTAARLGVGGW